MAFDLTTWGVIGGQGSRGKAGQMATYRSTDDLATVAAAGYFNEVRNSLDTGDVIMYSQTGANLGTNFLTVAAAPSDPALDVTMEAADINSA